MSKFRRIALTELLDHPVDHFVTCQCRKGAQVEPGWAERKRQTGWCALQVDPVHDNIGTKRRTKDTAGLSGVYHANTDSGRSNIIGRHDNRQSSRQIQVSRGLRG